MSSKLGDDSLYNNIERRQYKRLESPFMPFFQYTARFRVKQFEDQEISSPDWEIVAVKNLGAEGMIFEYNKNLELDSLLDLKIDFFKSMPDINCIGRVLRIEEFQPNSTSSITVKFTEINEQEKEMINTNVENILRKETNGNNFNLDKLKKMKDTVTRGVTMAEARLELEKAKDAELEKTMLELEKAKNAEFEKIRLELEKAKHEELEKIGLEQEQAKHEELEETRLPFFLKIFSTVKNFNLEKQKKMKETLIRGRLIMAETRLELEQAKDAELEKAMLELEQAKDAELEETRLELERAKNAELEKIRLEQEQAKHEELEKIRLKQEQAKHEELEKIRLEQEQAKHEELEKTRLELEKAKDAELEKTMLELEKAKDVELEETRLPFFLKIFSAVKNFNLEKQKKMKDTVTRGVTMAEARLELEKAKDAELEKTMLELEKAKDVELEKTMLELEKAKNAERLYIQRW